MAITYTITGATISGTETDSVQAYRISGSRGPGAGFSIGKVDTTKNPVEIKSRNTNYYANGVERTTDTATLTQNTDGTLTLNGKGTCLPGGTGAPGGRRCIHLPLGH